MANKKWYVLRVRQGFEAVVAERLRQLDLEVFIPEQKVISLSDRHDAPQNPAAYICCRFALDSQLSVTSIPGVFDILGTADPQYFDENLFRLKWGADNLQMDRRD